MLSDARIKELAKIVIIFFILFVRENTVVRYSIGSANFSKEVPG